MFSAESLQLLQEDIQFKKQKNPPPPKPKFSNVEMTLKKKRKFQLENVKELGGREKIRKIPEKVVCNSHNLKRLLEG